jgi:hypothetical protein
MLLQVQLVDAHVHVERVDSMWTDVDAGDVGNAHVYIDACKSVAIGSDADFCVGVNCCHGVAVCVHGLCLVKREPPNSIG